MFQTLEIILIAVISIFILSIILIIIRDMIKEQLDSAGIKLSSDEHVIVEINQDDEYIVDGKHKALVLR